MMHLEYSRLCVLWESFHFIVLNLTTGLNSFFLIMPDITAFSRQHIFMFYSCWSQFSRIVWPNIWRWTTILMVVVRMWQCGSLMWAWCWVAAARSGMHNSIVVTVGWDGSCWVHGRPSRCVPRLPIKGVPVNTITFSDTTQEVCIIFFLGIIHHPNFSLKQHFRNWALSSSSGRYFTWTGWSPVSKTLSQIRILIMENTQNIYSFF